MSDCEFQSCLDAYHDGQLPDPMRGRVASHLPNCPACRAELAALDDLSSRLAGASADPIQPGELGRIQQGVDREIQQQLSGKPLLRTTGLLAALAASVLIISGVWLLDLPPLQGPAASGNSGVALAADWEQVAMTLQADPRPQVLDDSPFSPRYAAAVNWMLSGLIPTEQKPWAKPSSL